MISVWLGMVGFSCACAGAVHAWRLLRNDDASPRDVAWWGGMATIGGGGLLIYLLVLSKLLGADMHQFLAPSFLGPKPEGQILIMYGIVSAGIASLLAAGLRWVLTRNRTT